MAVKLYTDYLIRKKQYFPNVTDSEWNDWKWQVKNRITSVKDLKKYIELDESELEIIDNVLGQFRMAITPYYLTLINPDNKKDPVRLQAVPMVDEMHIGQHDLDDPLHHFFYQTHLSLLCITGSSAIKNSPACTGPCAP